MNTSIYVGRVCTIPKVAVIQLDGKSVLVCKFVIAVPDGIFDYSDKSNFKEGEVDFFECVAFGCIGKMISENYAKWSKIVIKGKMKNHRFSDVNNTKHFTNFLLVESAEYGDTEAVLGKTSGKRKPIERAIVSELKELGKLYTQICENGYLCIDEDNYYNIAMMNIKDIKESGL